MAMLMNPTKETMYPIYGGKTMEVSPDGGKLQTEEAAANHILNKFSPRGLCRLEFGDDEEKVAKDGLVRYYAFRKKMVMKYNQMVLARAQIGMSYIPPTEDVKRYAEDMGLALEAPFVQKSNESVIRLTELEKENKELKASIDAMMAKMTEFMGEKPDVRKFESAATTEKTEATTKKGSKKIGV